MDIPNVDLLLRLYLTNVRYILSNLITFRATELSGSIEIRWAIVLIGTRANQVPVNDIWR